MDTDFLIIGGGIAGTSAGARLSALGHVTLLEAEPALAYHASGRSAALYAADYGSDVIKALNRASRAALDTFDGGVLTPRGVMLVAVEGQEAAFQTSLHEMAMEPMPVAEAFDMVPVLNPDRVIAAALDTDAWDIDTDRLVQHFAKTFKAAGGEVRLASPVTSIQRHGAGWALQTSDGTITARHIVNAAGAWADQVAQMAGVSPIGLMPLRRSVARIPAPGDLDIGRWPMLLGAGETWYAKPDAGALIISPAEEDPVDVPHDAWPEDLILAEGIARYQEVAKFEVTRVTASWAGLRSFAPDRNLVLGPDPQEATFLWCAGQGGYGFQTAPAASQFLADLVAGRPPHLPQEIAGALDPGRF